jgi:hypothetical protein
MARVGLSSNRKFLRLARALDNQRALARGVLELLWEPCFEVGEPYVGTSDDIEAVCGWTGKRGTLTKALLDAGFPKGAGFIEPYEGDVRDRTEPHYQIHDFFHHCPEYAKSRRDRELEKTAPKTCELCGKTYYSGRLHSHFCSPRCRQRAWYRRHGSEPNASFDASEPSESPTKQAEPNAFDTSERFRTFLDGTPTPTPTPTPTRVRTYEDSSAALSRAEPAPADESGHEENAAITVVVADDPLRLTFPTVGVDGHEWYLTQSQVDEWQEAYPDLDILAECRKALQWVRADKQRRKTKRGMGKFLTGWLNRATDSPRGRGPTTITGSLKTAGNQEAIRRFVARGESK